MSWSACFFIASDCLFKIRGLSWHGLVKLLGRAAQPSIATVNFKTVFKGYWRTKLADKKILAKQEELDKALKKHIEGQNALGQEIQRIAQGLNLPNLTPLQQQRRQETFAKKRREYDDNGKAIQIFRNGKVKKIQEDDRKERDAIVGDIKVVVGGKAKQGGYTLVLDKGSLTVLFTDNSADLTDAVLTQLNLNAPAKVKPPAPKKK